MIITLCYRIPWKTFFDVESINRYVPVIELDDYLKQEGPIIDSVFYLQNYAEGWKDGKFEEKHDFRECIDRPRYHKEGKHEFILNLSFVRFYSRSTLC